MRLIPAALAALALVGCGAESSTHRGSPAELLVQAAETLRTEGAFRFTFEYVRTRADRPDDPERYADGRGALDLRTRRGRFAVDLGDVLPGAGGEYAIRWTATEVEVEHDSERRRRPRGEARERGGLLDRLPDEPEALVALLERGSDARSLGERKLDGRAVSVVACTVSARDLRRLRAPAELTRAASAGLLGDRLDFEAWIDEDVRPRRLVLRIDLEPVVANGRRVLPARTVDVVYDLEGFGEPVRGLEFRSQAG